MWGLTMLLVLQCLSLLYLPEDCIVREKLILDAGARNHSVISLPSKNTPRVKEILVAAGVDQDASDMEWRKSLFEWQPRKLA
jgi:hypothetical protein